METQLSGEASGKAIETGNTTNICIKNENETEFEQHSVTLTAQNEPEATIKIENCDILHNLENLVKCESVEFDKIDAADDILNQTATTVVSFEKIPKSEAKILSDDPTPTSASNEVLDLYHQDNLSEDSDPKHDPFADVGGDPLLSQIPQISHSSSGSSTAAAAVQDMKTSAEDPDRLCSICNQLFPSAQSYIFHALKIHGTNEAISSRYSFKCQLCTSCFPSNEALNAHLTSSHETDKTNEPNCKPQPFKCLLCPSAYTNHIELTNHMQSHKNRPRFKCPMPNCEEAFNFNGRLQNHLTNDHSKERSFKCQEPNCGKTFKINGQLQRHMLSHLEERHFKCPHLGCNSAFKINELLTQHLTVHTGASRYVEAAPGPFKCGQCERPFTKNWKLNLHLKTHTKEIFECPEPSCSRRFNFKQNSMSHFTNMHQIAVPPLGPEPSSKQNHCKSHFTNKYSNKHTLPLQRPEPNCEKTLQNKNSRSILYHQFLSSLHSKKVVAVSFKCNEPNCGKKFKTKDYLREHLINHTRPYKCTELGCLGTFATARDFKFHVESKHTKNAENTEKKSKINYFL